MSHFHFNAQLQQYCFNVQWLLNKVRMAAREEGWLPGVERDQVEIAVQEVLQWIDVNWCADEHEIEAKREELAKIVTPMMMKIWSNDIGIDDFMEEALRVGAKEALQNYSYNTCILTVRERKYRGMFEPDDKRMIEEAVQDVLEWIDQNSNLGEEEYFEKKCELERVAGPKVIKALLKRAQQADTARENLQKYVANMRQSFENLTDMFVRRDKVMLDCVLGDAEVWLSEGCKLADMFEITYFLYETQWCVNHIKLHARNPRRKRRVI